MKTQINHSHRNSTANYIFFGITLSIFLLSIFFSLVQHSSDTYTKARVTSILSHKKTHQVISPVIEVSPIDLKQYLTEVIEEPIVIDSWMTETSWITATTTFEYINADYTEAAIPVQDWMTSTVDWPGIATEEYTETAIPLEDWMLSTRNWKLFNNLDFNESAIEENEIPLENWMLDITSWNLPYDEQYTEAAIPIEDWMLSTSSWLTIEALNTNYDEPEIALENWMLSISNWETFQPSIAEK